MTMDIADIADIVSADLEALGYTVLANSDNIPAVVVSNHVCLICVRKDVDGVYLSIDGVLYYLQDYHFMKLSEDGSWYHKPGQTNPLRYKYTPSNSSVWIVEGRNSEGLFQYTNWTYDSDIYYIAYTTPHEWEYVYCGTPNGTHQHINTCTICWQTSGTAIACTYRTGSDVCKICGHNKNAAITSLGLPEDTYTYVNE